MEDSLSLLRAWILEKIEDVEERYDSPPELDHVDGNDFIDVLLYVKQELDALIDVTNEEVVEPEEIG